MIISKIALTINGKNYSVKIAPEETLNTLLRNRLGLTGTKKGCGSGKCGACTVIVNGHTVNSCLLPAMDCSDADITTVEGLAPSRDKQHPLQDAFIRHGAVQCGFCTPGMLMSAKDLLDKNPAPTRDEIKTGLSGNLCRCTGYQKIVDAVESVVEGTVPQPIENQPNIGGNYYRRDAVEHVRGASKFGADVVRPNMLYGKVLRSRYAHALIKNIDISAAEDMPGVLAVVTGKEVPVGYFGVDIKDRLVFARDKVRHRGDAVAAVAAVSEEIAVKALEKIKVDYTPLQPVFDARKAMRPDAPTIHEDLANYEIGFKTETRGNICTVARVAMGDMEAGFADSDIVLEETFSTQIQHQASMETHAALAEEDVHGRLTVWSTTQKPFAMRRYLSQSLKLPMNSIRVKATKIGGGFGGKLELLVEPYAVLLARKCGRPVQIVYARDEEFLATTPRHKTYFRVKSGIKNDGTLVARHAKFIYDTGAYSGNGPTTITLSSQLISGLYRIPNLFIEGYCVYTNKMNCGSMRGPSGPQTTFAMESHMDNLARKIGMDPLDFRLMNLLEKGEKTGVGQTLVDVDYKKAVRQAAQKAGWRTMTTGKNVGKGMACIFWLSGGWSTSATVNINEDGTVNLVTGAVDMGTGYLYTSVPQIVAHELGIRPQEVHLVVADTDQTTYDHGIGGSRGVFTVGKVAQMAAIKARAELFAAAAQKLQTRPEKLATQNGWVYIKDNPEDKVSFGEISFERHIRWGGPISGAASYLPEMDSIDPSRVEGLSFSAFKGTTIGCHMAVVEVKPDTGQIEILKYVAAHDVGKAINPIAVEGQIQGGVSMGIGFALTEEVLVGDEGQVLNSDFADYKLPTALDVPDTKSVIIEEPCDYGPHGAKGLGEPTMGPPAAAIGNAIYDAAGIRMRSTPMTPEKVKTELEKR